MTRQVINEYEELRGSVNAGEQFYEDYMAMKEDLNSLLSQVNNPLSPLFGVGSPEGLVTSNLSRTYYDTTNSPVSVTIYINENSGVNTGWVVAS